MVNGSGAYWQYQTFKSSRFNPPELQITGNGGSISPGFLFMTPGDSNPLGQPITKNPAPMIMADDGQLVWMGPVGPAVVTNLHVTEYSDRPVLIYWTGTTYVGRTFGLGWGSIKMLDAGYNEIVDFCPKVGLVTHDNSSFPCKADVHESAITSRNNILWLAYNTTQSDLTSIGGSKDGWTWELATSGIQSEDPVIKQAELLGALQDFPGLSERGSGGGWNGAWQLRFAIRHSYQGNRRSIVAKPWWI